MSPLAVVPGKSHRLLVWSLAGTLVVAGGLLVWLCLLLPGELAGDGATDGGPSGGKALTGSPPEFDLYEPVVRSLLPRAAAAAGPGRPVVYVGLPEGDSAEAFCRRFRGQPVAVRPLSGDGKDSAGQGAYLIYINEVSGAKVQWEGSHQARVFVLDYPARQPPTCGTPYPVRVRREGGQWVVQTP
jgi:hypothetical protein